MEVKTKKAFESGKLYGVYRCGKREKLLRKIPQIEKLDMPDATGIIISGIMNFGNDSDTIRAMAKDAIGCDAEDIKIPYDESKFARQRFINEIIIGKLTGSIRFSVQSLIDTFYDFLDMPTDATKQMQAKDDIRDINRYINCEQRKPILIGQPVVTIDDTDFICQTDCMFAGYQTVKVNKHREGRRWVYDEMCVYAIEAVRIFSGKPNVKESSKILDTGTNTRLEFYIMLKAMQEWASKNKPGENVLLRASYYFLQKERENDNNYKDDFFGKGGNVVTLQAFSNDMSEIDKSFIPQIKEFVAGQSVSAEKCQNCKSRVLCEYHDAAVPLTEEERPKPTSLPILSKDQTKAATTLSGNIRVIATAGSGKTTAMAYRIMNLIKSGVEPSKIGCFTFTNAGAGEMKDRIKGFCDIAGLDVDIEQMVISTIHSFGDSLLKDYHYLLGYTKPPVLINEIQKTKIVEKILSENDPIDELIDRYKNFYLDMFKAKGILELMKGYFSAIQEGMSQDDLKESSGLQPKTVDAIYSMYMQYDKYKKEACLIEHSDQELGVLKLLRVHPELFDEVGIEHISVDEYQDTSNVQFEIINAMRKASCVKSLFIVGDDDQSIYGFRDANVELIKNFFDMIGETHGTDVRLMENRRSTGNIVDFAATLISFNEDRIDKKPKSTNELGIPVNVEAFDMKETEQEYIIESVEELIKNGRKENEIAILAPTNMELLTYADMLQKKGIKTVSINPEPILENPRVLGAIGLVRFMLYGSEFGGTAYINAKTNGAAISKTNEEIRDDILALQEVASGIKNVTSLFEKFKELDTDENDEIYQSFLDDINTAMGEAVKMENLPAVCEYVIDFERFGQKQTARKEKAYDGVVLSTMHSSKGKEWPVVFCSVTKLQNRDMACDAIPEKNRLLFVACTRAKKELYISGVKNVSGWGTQGDENLFLAECLEVKKTFDNSRLKNAV